jgi:hypothetical protein
VGTSQSSKGPGGGVPMVPPWTPSIPPAGPPDSQPMQAPSDAPAPDGEPPQTSPIGNPDGASPQGASPMAPGTRFQRARLSLGRYARNGDRSDLQRALRNYVRHGYGGSGTATRRAGGTIATAGAFSAALAALAGGEQDGTGGPLDRELLADAAFQDIVNAIVDASRVIDGTLDAEAERASINTAVSDVLDAFPDADVLNLDEEQRIYAVERFAANDVFRRFELDLGKVIIDKAPTLSAAAARLKEAGDYVKECVVASFRKLREVGRIITAKTVKNIVRDALKAAFDVFEEYTR